VTLIAAGGMADIYYIIDTDPAAVSAAYLGLVGKPVLIP
jgi:alpha-glucosidase (family GH31 glycosyl hydrolase)